MTVSTLSYSDDLDLRHLKLKREPQNMGAPSCAEEEAAALLSGRMQLPASPEQQQLQQQQQQQQQQPGTASPTKRKKNADAGSSPGGKPKPKRLCKSLSSGSASSGTKTKPAGQMNSVSCASVGKCPPRDMKRLKLQVAYEVTRVAKWGEKLAVFLINPNDPRDSGFYKPPEAYRDHIFHIGDLITLENVGYSQSRNRVARSIAIDTTNAECKESCDSQYGSEGGCCSRSFISAAGAEQSQNAVSRKANSNGQARKFPAPSSSASQLQMNAMRPFPIQTSLAAQFLAKGGAGLQNLTPPSNGMMNSPSAVAEATANQAAAISAALQRIMSSPTSPAASVASTLTAASPSPTASPVPAIGSHNFANAMGGIFANNNNEMLLASILNMQKQQQQQQQSTNNDNDNKNKSAQVKIKAEPQHQQAPNPPQWPSAGAPNSAPASPTLQHQQHQQQHQQLSPEQLQQLQMHMKLQAMGMQNNMPAGAWPLETMLAFNQFKAQQFQQNQQQGLPQRESPLQSLLRLQSSQLGQGGTGTITDASLRAFLANPNTRQ